MYTHHESIILPSEPQIYAYSDTEHSSKPETSDAHQILPW